MSLLVFVSALIWWSYAFPALFDGRFRPGYILMSMPFLVWTAFQVLPLVLALSTALSSYLGALGALGEFLSSTLFFGMIVFGMVGFFVFSRYSSVFQNLKHRMTTINPYEKGLIAEFRHALEMGVPNTRTRPNSSRVVIGDTVVQVRSAVLYRLMKVEDHFWNVVQPQVLLQKKLEVIREREVPL